MAVITRRNAMTTLGAAAGVGLLSAVGVKWRGPKDNGDEVHSPTKENGRMPAVFVPHGGGPWPFVESGFGAPGVLESYLKKLSRVTPRPPKALLVISAHWEAPAPTVMTTERPVMLYDYYGFPEEAYHVQWPAPGDPSLAEQVRERLTAAGFKSDTDSSRGFDHGAFVVTAVAYPQAAVPTFQLSLKRGLDPAEHLAMGRALAPFRDEDVFIIGSGMSYHNLPGFMEFAQGNTSNIGAVSKAFDDWLAETVILDPTARENRLVEWEKAPAARACHPREEHLLPLMVIAGAADDDAGTVPYRDVIYGAHTLAARFG